VMRVSRCQGGDDALFGSSVRHDHKIRIAIDKATLVRDDLHYDRYYRSENIIEVEMSQSQWAEFLTSMNMGGGTPCTIRRLPVYEKVKRTESVPTLPKREQFAAEFKRQLHKLTQGLKEHTDKAEEILAKKTINKSDREALRNVYYHVHRIVTDSIPFMQTMWNEQMDKTLHEVKGEFEAFMESAATARGLKELYEQVKGGAGTILQLEKEDVIDVEDAD